MHNPKAEAVAISIMEAIRRYADSSLPSPDGGEDQGLMDEIEATLTDFYDDIHSSLSNHTDDFDRRISVLES